MFAVTKQKADLSERLSTVLDFLIKLFVIYQPLHAQDNTYVLNKIIDISNIASWITAIMDKESLQNIVHCEDKEALQCYQS